MPPLGLQRLLTVPLLLLIGSLASADAITGRVVDPNGVGVAGVDIDFVSLGSGGNPHELNDGTDANGNFFTTVDPGIYEIRFFPPPPPATTLLTGILPSVVVTGTKNLGTITLSQGVSVQATVKNAANQPVSNVRLEVYRVDTGAKLHMKGNASSAFGVVNVAVPAATDLIWQYLTSGVIGQVLVPREFTGSVPGSINLGTIPLQTGFHVTGTVVTQSGVAVIGADVDVTVLPAGNTLFTPSDNTNSLGVFDVVVPAGTYDLEITRPASLILVAVDVDDLAVSAATNLGVLTMRNGVFLSGTVRDRANQIVQGADVNAIEVATGLPIALGSDNSNAAGFYSVVVPTGLLDVTFSPPGPHDLFEKRRVDGLSVTNNTTLDTRLPGVPEHGSPTVKVPGPGGSIIVPFGSSAAGPRTAMPFLQGSSVRGGVRLSLIGGVPGARVGLVFGADAQVLPGSTDAHRVAGLVTVPLTLDGEGAASFTLPRSALSQLGGPLLVQAVQRDPDAPHGIARTHVLTLPAER
jgi:hypothetical protein